MANKNKVYTAEAEVVAVNQKDLPKRLGLLLRNADGEEKWFTWWKNSQTPLPIDLQKGAKVDFSYTMKLGQNGKGPFLNIVDLEVTDQPEAGGDNQASLREIEIRADVALKAAAGATFVGDADEILELADQFYCWITAKVNGASR